MRVRLGRGRGCGYRGRSKVHIGVLEVVQWWGGRVKYVMMGRDDVGGNLRRAVEDVYVLAKRARRIR